MAQISKGDTFVDGQQVTGARLNQLVDSSVLLVGAITDQPSITANTLQSTDTTIVNDGGVLKEATIGDFLNSNLPITTSSITGGAGVDIAVTPAAGQKFDVGGAFESTTSNTTGNSTVGGNLAVTGTTTLTGNATINGATTINGLTNITEELRYDGIPVFGLSSITETTISPLQFDATTSAQVTATCNIWRTLHTISSLTKTNKEIWEVLADFPVMSYGYNAFRMRLLLVSTNTVLGEITVKVEPTSGVAYQYQYSQQKISVVIPEGTVLTNDSIRLEGFYVAFQALAGAIAWAGYTSAYWANPQTSKARITRYRKP